MNNAPVAVVLNLKNVVASETDIFNANYQYLLKNGYD